jgi:hypothetical protein
MENDIAQREYEHQGGTDGYPDDHLECHLDVVYVRRQPGHDARGGELVDV